MLVLDILDAVRHFFIPHVNFLPNNWKQNKQNKKTNKCKKYARGLG